MNKLSFVFVAGLALAAFGCKKKGGGADCDKAINHGMELAKADMAGIDAKTLEKMKDIGVQHCKDDKWGDDALKCMVDAKTETDAQACYGKLTKDQQDKMNKAAMEASAGAVPGGSAAAGSDTAAGSAAAGSDTAAGSAAAGSAAAGSADGSAGSAAEPK